MAPTSSGCEKPMGDGMIEKVESAAQDDLIAQSAPGSSGFAHRKIKFIQRLICGE